MTVAVKKRISKPAKVKNLDKELSIVIKETSKRIQKTAEGFGVSVDVIIQVIPKLSTIEEASNGGQ